MTPKTKTNIKSKKELNLVLENREFDNLLNLPRHNPKSKTRKIAISLKKGGVGKTTTATNLAHGLAIHGRKVLLVDTDPQAQAQLILGANPMFGTYEFSNPEETKRLSFGETVHVDANRRNLHFLAGNASIDYWEEKAKTLALQPEHELNPFIKYEHITNSFQQIEKMYDYIIFDTAPSMGLMTNNVLFYADELLVPTFLSKMSEDSIEKFLTRFEQVNDTRKRLGFKELKLKYFLPTFFQSNTVVSRSKYQELVDLCESLRNAPNQREGLKEVKLLHPIPYNTKINQLADFGKTIFEHAPTSLGGQAYGIVVEEIIKDEQK